MSDCGCHAEAKNEAERRILRLALGLNATMFVVGAIAGLIAQSMGLIADSLGSHLIDGYAMHIDIHAQRLADRGAGEKAGLLDVVAVARIGRCVPKITDHRDLILEIAQRFQGGRKLEIAALALRCPT